MSSCGGENAVEQVSEMLIKFTDSGLIDPGALAEAESDQWDRITPKKIMVATIQIILRLRWENGLSTIEQVAPAHVHAISRSDLLEITKALLGSDQSADSDELFASRFSLLNVMRLLSALFDEESISSEEARYLISSAVDFCKESLQGGNLLRRGVEFGPWDIGEVDISGLDLVDLGGILVPPASGMIFRPVEVNGEIIAVTLVQGDTALQLQAFIASEETVWEVVRADMISKMRKQGNSVETIVDKAGIEIRATVSVMTEPGATGTRDIRVLGSDGPGWMLRAVVSGSGASPGGDDEWAYKTFLGAVVARRSLSRKGDVITLRLPKM
ncbi:Protein of unknown function [Streptomyces sp. ScaeMP-e48]|uniref:DUF3710 domain-containing protein n=1 Tax=Streptomyces TaxID=1883 RepID=UPI000823F617|nr:DUF3710 domain-containing protein [Streptomyces sp. ScaeMP-e48]SCK54105.1 Protein of unknown function [Streptomyces sp. ScaeMP-e48]